MHYKVETHDILESLILDDYGPFVRGILSFGGHLNVEALKKAVALSEQTLPLIACRFRKTGLRPKWIQTGLSGEDLVRFFQSEADDVEPLITRYCTGRYNLTSKPQLDMLVIRHGAVDTLCFTMSHLLCDAGGMKEYMSVLTALYQSILRGEPPPKQQCHSRSARIIMKGISLPARVKMILWPDRSVHALASEYENQAIGWRQEASSRKIVSHTFEGRQWKGIQQYATEQGLMINDIFSAAFAMAQAEELRTNRIRVTITSDLRRFIPRRTPYGITNFSNTHSFYITRNDEDDLGDVARKIIPYIKKIKDKMTALYSFYGLGLIVFWTPYPLLRKAMEPYLKTPRYVLTNCGTIRKGRMRFGDLQMTGFRAAGTICRNGVCVFTMTTFEQRCTILCPLYATEERIQEAQRILDAMRKTLENASATAIDSAAKTLAGSPENQPGSEGI